MTIDDFKEIDSLLTSAPCSKLIPTDNCKYHGYTCFKCQAQNKLRENFLKTNSLKGKVKSFFSQVKTAPQRVLLMRTLSSIKKK